MDDQANQVSAQAAPAAKPETTSAPVAQVLTEPVQASAAPVILPAPLPVEPEPVIAPADQPSVRERARALVDGYQHALATNSPRTVAELAELKALLDIDGTERPTLGVSADWMPYQKGQAAKNEQLEQQQRPSSPGSL